MKKVIYFVTSFLIIFYYGCSSSQETASGDSEKQPDIYVFDDVDKVDSVSTDSVSLNQVPIKNDSSKVQIAESKTESTKSEFYTVQIGAFSTYERAQTFMKENQPKTSYKFNSFYNDQTKLFVVRTDEYATREEAEKIRNFLWQFSSMKGAFIITLEK